MSLIEELQKTSGKTSESASNIVKQFLDASENFDTATELINPDGMTFSDFSVLFLMDNKERCKVLGIKGKHTVTDAEMMGYYLKRNRINWESNQRKSRSEGVQVALGAQAAEEKKLREKVAEGIGLR